MIIVAGYRSLRSTIISAIYAIHEPARRSREANRSLSTELHEQPCPDLQVSPHLLLSLLALAVQVIVVGGVIPIEALAAPFPALSAVAMIFFPLQGKRLEEMRSKYAAVLQI